MINQVGNDITILKGETLPIEVTVYDSAGALATNLTTAKFVYTDSAGTAATKTCTILGAVVSVVFSEAETLLMSGTYMYEMRVKDDDDNVNSVSSGYIYVHTGLITTTI